MIYKFIDNNGAEITVNSLSSLQALVESQTIKKNTFWSKKYCFLVKKFFAKKLPQYIHGK